MQRASEKLTLLLSSVVGKNDINAQNMGVEHYSYAVSMNAYKPYLSSFAEVITLDNPASQVDYYYRKISEQGGSCLHLAFGQPVGIYVSRKCPTLGVIFWEFPDIPNEEIQGVLRHNWLKAISGLKGLIVHSRENLVSFRKAACDLPIGLWRTPIPDQYFNIGAWKNGQNITINAPIIEICKMGISLNYKENAASYDDLYTKLSILHFKQALKQVWHTFVHMMGMFITRKIPERVKQFTKKTFFNLLKTSKAAYHSTLAANNQKLKTGSAISVKDNLCQLEISGIVYTTLLNSNDGRKNWSNLIKGFVWAFKGKKEVTLIIKLIDTSNTVPNSIKKIKNYIENLGVYNGPKIILLAGYLNDESMRKLALATTYYINLSHAEGQCLPLNEYLAAGRPAVCPCHSSLQDFVSPEYCFIIDSYKSPTYWPHNPPHLRTTWSEINMESYMQNLNLSYSLAIENYPKYLEMSHASRNAMIEYFDKSKLQSKISDFIWDLMDRI